MATSAAKKKSRVTVENILEAATAEFIEQGYHKATISAIVKRIGGSNRNIYEYFGDKFGLYQAVINGYRDRLAVAIDMAMIEEGTVSDYLRALAQAYLRSCLDPRGIAMHRLVISEAVQFPELGESVLENAEDPLIERLAAYLDERTRAGELDVRDPAEAAGMFLALVRGEIHIRIAYGQRKEPSAERLDEYVDNVVDLFLRGVTPRAELSSDRAVAPRKKAAR